MEIQQPTLLRALFVALENMQPLGLPLVQHVLLEQATTSKARLHALLVLQANIQLVGLQHALRVQLDSKVHPLVQHRVFLVTLERTLLTLEIPFAPYARKELLQHPLGYLVVAHVQQGLMGQLKGLLHALYAPQCQEVHITLIHRDFPHACNVISVQA